MSSIERKLYRARWEEFVSKHRKWIGKRPKVVCAPHKETHLEEVIASYDHLGIPQKDLTLLVPAGTPVIGNYKVSHRSIEDYFNSTIKPFDIVDLEDKRPLSFKSFDVLNKINKQMGKKALVSTSYLGKLEGNQIFFAFIRSCLADYLCELNNWGSLGKICEASGIKPHDLTELAVKFNELTKKNETHNFKWDRRYGHQTNFFLIRNHIADSPKFRQEFKKENYEISLLLKDFVDKYRKNMKAFRFIGLYSYTHATFDSGSYAYRFRYGAQRVTPIKTLENHMGMYVDIFPEPIIRKDINYGMQELIDKIVFWELDLAEATRLCAPREQKILIESDNFDFVSNHNPYIGQFLAIEKIFNYKYDKICKKRRKAYNRGDVVALKKSISLGEEHVKELNDMAEKYSKTHTETRSESLDTITELERVIGLSQETAVVAQDLKDICEYFGESNENLQVTVGERMLSSLPARYGTVFSPQEMTAFIPHLNLGVYGKGVQPVSSKSVEDLLSTYADVFDVSPDLLKKAMTRLNMDSVQTMTSPEDARRYIEGLQ